MEEIQMPSISEIKKFDIEELAKSNRKRLNAFFLYRREFTKRAVSNGIRMKMTELSKLAANSWKNESTKVRKAYIKVSSQIDGILQKRRQENKTYHIIYDHNMEKIPQEQGPIANQLAIAPPQYYPHGESNVDDITFPCSLGINSNMEMIPQEPVSINNQPFQFHTSDEIFPINLDDMIFPCSFGNMERVPQEPKPVVNQLDLVPPQTFQPYEYLYGINAPQLSVDSLFHFNFY
ncbi:MATA-HMG [Gigaspora margarita]|uniref:MATA-HMG n=1 Tax=Gigaspora margarita TaxID=4874 RepID=A0A8H4ARJ0_GIGMA|nr:MATA-HMG [Gigaspora margarita]